MLIADLNGFLQGVLENCVNIDINTGLELSDQYITVF